MTVAAASDLRTLPSSALGAPGPADPARCSLVAIEAVTRSSGEGLRLASLALDVASHVLPSGEIEIRTTVDKRTRSIVFASVEAWMGKQPVFTAQALFAAASSSPA